jgi:hypothetical protein
MWSKIVTTYICVSLATTVVLLAQESSSRSDSINLYENIASYSERSGVTRFIYRTLFKPVNAINSQTITHTVLTQEPYSSFEGKTIRHIHIVTLDPFGNSIGDTIKASLNFLSRAGNSFHIKTRPVTIRNMLLFRQNHAFDSLLVKESERLVRSNRYITDVSFFVRQTSEDGDSVDIFIRELDSWSTIPGGFITAKRLAVSLRENNFLGFGHQFHHAVIWNYLTDEYAYKTKYFIPNIRHTYINSTLLYGTDEYGNFIKSFGIDRPFFSPFAKWAAGVNVSQHLSNDSVWTSNYMQFKYNAQDYWAGNAIRIFKGNTEFSRTTNFISSARYLRIRFLEKPAATIDTLKYYTDENLFLVSMGVSIRQYIRDRHIFKFGITEDVPIGSVISLTGGYQQKNKARRTYFGARFSSGNYHSWGYLSTNVEFGTFFLPSRAEQGVLSVNINYFTNLIEIGRWRFRHFIKPQFDIGFNRTDYEKLILNNEYGIYGFNSTISGNSRLLLTSQTQSYAPIDFIGFHFGPYVAFSLGMLGDVESGFHASKVYSQIGIGVLIKNDNLVMNTFQLSIAYYPVMPGRGKNIFKVNPFETTDFGFQDFEIGKPATVRFR